MKTVHGLLGVTIFAISTAPGTDWAPMRDVEIHEKSKWIVIGTMQVSGEKADLKWRIRVEKVLKGPRVESLSVVPNKFEFGYLLKGEERRLFCVGEAEGKSYLFHPGCLRTVDEGEKAMETARKLLADPRGAILKPAGVADPEVVYVIGKWFAPDADPAEWTVGRGEALAYLKRALDLEEPELTLETFKALRRMEDRALEPAVRKLLTVKTQAWAVRPMVGYLRQTEAPEAIRHLEALLRTTAPGYPVHHLISDYCAEALGQIGKPQSVGVLEAAARHGVQRAIEALIMHGTVDSLDMLYETYLAAAQPGSQPNALHWLVRRSNRPVEPWMYPSSYSTKVGLSMKDQWQAWWAKHREGFQIVRTFEEARARWDAERAR